MARLCSLSSTSGARGAGVRQRAAPLLCALALTLTACNTDPPGPSGPSMSPGSPVSSGSVDVTASGSPTVAPPPEEPELPAAAREATEDGARAFVGYYWELVNYAQATGDVKRLRQVSAPTCDVCVAFVEKVRALYSRGGRILGGANRSEVTELVDLELESGGHGLRVEHNVSHDAQTIINADGDEDAHAAGTDHFTAFLLWVGQRWRLDVMELR